MTVPAYTFQKRSLSARVAETLREKILCGDLQNPLPGEHRLAESLGVSRPVLRSALAALSRDGLIQTAKGRRTRILRQGIQAPSGPRRICVIDCSKQGDVVPSGLTFMEQIHLRLAEEGIVWERVSVPALSGSRLTSYLTELVAGRKNTCWLLAMSPAPVQAFFASSGQPALILGSNFPDIALPAIDWDYGAVGRHAAHTLLRSGHRRPALFLPVTMMAGDRATQQGFKAALEEYDAEVVCSEVCAHCTREEIGKACDRLLRKGGRPDAVFVFRTSFAFALLTRALSRGVAIPGDMSLLCRDDHPIFEAVFPAVDRYTISESRFLHNALRLLHSLLEGQPLDSQPHFIIPEQIRGETVIPH